MDADTRLIDSPKKKIVVATGKNEYEIPDPSMYVTRVINPEKEVQKRVMAKELDSALQEQIANKKRAKEEEKKNRRIEELKEEAKWLKEREEFDRANLPKSRPQNVDILEIKADAVADLQKTPSSPPSQPPDPEPILPKEAEVEKPKFTHKLDMQLKKLQNEMLEKEKEFNMELEKLKMISSQSTNARDAADKQLDSLKDHIVRHPAFTNTSFVPSLGFKADSIKQRFQRGESNSGIGKYSRFYFTDYKKTLATYSASFAGGNDDLLEKKRYRSKPIGDNFLAGESQMLPWRPYEDSPKMKTTQDFTSAPGSKTINILSKGRISGKSTYETLDDLMKEFLSQKKREDKHTGGNFE